MTNASLKIIRDATFTVRGCEQSAQQCGELSYNVPTGMCIYANNDFTATMKAKNDPACNACTFVMSSPPEYECVYTLPQNCTSTCNVECGALPCSPQGKHGVKETTELAGKGFVAGVAFAVILFLLTAMCREAGLQG